MAYAVNIGSSWQARWQTAELRADGRPKEDSKAGFRKKREALTYAEDQEAAIRAGTWIDPKAGTKPLGEWWTTWIAAQDRKPNTIESYTQQYTKHVAPRWGNTPLNAIRPILMDAWLKEIRSTLGASTMTIITTVLRGMLEDAQFNNLIGRSPMPPKKRGAASTKGAPPRPGVVIPLETIERILVSLASDADRVIVLLALFTGMRWSEIVGMRTRHLMLSSAGTQYYIDPQTGAVHEDASAKRDYGPPKSGPGRLVDFPPFLAELVRLHIATLGDSPDALFLNRNGTLVGYDTWMQTRWRRVCDGRAAEVLASGRVREAVPGAGPGLVFHDLKHTHAAMMDDLGTHTAMRHYRLGHVIPGAPGVYSHPTPAMRADLVAGLQRVWEEWRSAPVSRSTPVVPQIEQIAIF
jgi:integrase